MKSRFFLIRFFLLALTGCGISGNLHAQYSLLPPYNNPRSGDTIVKQQVEYRDPGRNGSGVLWDFSRLKEICPEYKIDYLSASPDYPGYIVATERDALYHYFTAGDSCLYLLCFETPFQRMDYERPGRALRYPLNMGDQYSDSIRGKAVDGNLEKTIQYAVSRTSCDASGMIVLPGGDTLHQVLRIHTLKETYEIRPIQSDSLQNNPPNNTYRYATQDTLRLSTETYRWYAQGYRYAVFESEKMEMHKGDKTNNYYQSSYLYHPKRHTYLETDTLNQALLEQLYPPEEPFVPLLPETERKREDSFAYNVYPNPVKGVLRIEYFLSFPKEITLSILDMAGQVLIGRKKEYRDSGIYQEKLDLTGYPTGSYTLVLQVGEKPYTQIILKQE